MSPKFVVYQDIGRNWRWRLVAANGEIVAVSEAYVTKDGAHRSALRVKVIAQTATIVAPK